MPSILLPAQLALHVLLLLVLAPEDMPTPPSSPSSDPRLDAEGGRARLSPAFASSLLCLLLRELLAPEGDGLSFAQLKGEILAIADETTGPEARLPAGASQTEGPRLLRQLQFELIRLADVATYFDFVRLLQATVNERDEDVVGPSAPPLDRKSPLGLAVRRFVLLTNGLDFPRVLSALEALSQWVDGDGTSSGQLDAKSNPDPRPASFSAYLSALHTGSYSEALANLHRFFSHPIPLLPGGIGESDLAKEGRADGMHHHALLNLASFHFGHEEWEAARLILAEALRIARAASDRAALEKCLSLARRLEAATGSSSTVGRGALAGAAFSAEAEPFERLCASDQLFVISHLFSRGTPLPEIQRLVYQSLGTLDREEFPPDETTPQAAQGQMPPRALDPAGGQKGKVPPPVKQDVENGAWESLVGGVWAAMGEDRLARLREDALLGLTPVKHQRDDSLPLAAGLGARLSAIQSRSLRMALQGAYLPALEGLFGPPSVDLLQLSLAQYRSWASTVWQVLDTWAARTGEVGAREMIAVFRGSAPAKEPSLEDDEDDEDGPSRGTRANIELRLKKAHRYKAVHLPSYALPLILGAVETSRELCFFGLYRTSTIALADVMIDLGEGAFASGLVDEVFAQILGGEDAELSAFAGLTKARALLLASEANVDREPDLVLAASYLRRSIAGYAALSSGSAQHLLALRTAAGVAHARGQSDERDALAEEWERAANEADARGRGGERRLEDIVRRVAQGVADLGVAVNLGWR